MRHTKSLLAIVCSLLVTTAPSIGNAAVYQCKTASGALTFQERPCPAADSQEIVQIVTTPAPAAKPTPQADTNSQNQTKPLSSLAQHPAAIRREKERIERIEREEQAKIAAAKLQKQRCRQWRKNRAARTKRIKEDCKKRRDTYCDQSADRIVAIRDAHWSKGATEQQLRNHARNNQYAQHQSYQNNKSMAELCR